MAVITKENHAAIWEKVKIIKEGIYLELYTIINIKLRDHLI